MLEIGSLVDGKYKILGKIGQGGMSVVYLAINEKANKPWAIKEVRRDGKADSALVRQGLMEEVRLLKKLRHPNLPSVVDVIEEEGALLLVMDYIEGRTLEEFLKERGAQTQNQAAEWIKELCKVLAYLHTRTPPIVYRDLKPSNIMLTPAGKVMLIDFGTALELDERYEENQICLGTQGYAAPEQYLVHGKVDERTDIYSLGAVFYFLLTGKTLKEEPLCIGEQGIPSGLASILTKCLQKDPKNRYQSCGELLYSLEHYREREEKFRNIQRRRWNLFCASVFTGVFAFLGAAAVRWAENSLAHRTSTEYLKEAAFFAETDRNLAVGYYEKAITVNPSSGTAYEALLHFFLFQNQESSTGDQELVFCVFSEQEEQEMRKVLGERGRTGKSNEEMLRKNQEMYEKFSYELGLAYFYSYEGRGNKGAAGKWLQTAAQADPSPNLGRAEITRAGCLYRISQYYSSLGIQNQAGDAMVSYKDYWEDLIELSEEAKNSKNSICFLLAARELTGQIASKAGLFQQAGILQKEMEEVLGKIRKEMEKPGFTKEDPQTAYQEELKQFVEQNLKAAQKSIEAVFHGEGSF